MVGLQFIVGTSFAATTLLQLTAAFNLLPSPCRSFQIAGDGRFAIASVRQILGCVRLHDNYLS
jgi:hypothetical protein